MSSFILHIVPYASDAFYTLFANGMNEYSSFENYFFVPCCKNGKRAYKSAFLKLPSLFKVDFCYSWFNKFFIKKKAKKILKAIESSCIKKIDLIHAHCLFSAGSAAYLMKKKYGTKYIVAVRSSDIDFFYKYKLFDRRFIRKVIEEAETIVFISEQIRKKTLASIKSKKTLESILSKSIIIPNGINDVFFNNTQNKHLDNKHLNFLYVGKNLKFKNNLKVCKLLENSCDRPFIFTIVGPSFSSKYEKRFLKYPFLRRVSEKKPSELLDLYSSNDIYIMLSKHETFGISYIEAMSQGLPVIYSKNTGIDGMFEDESVGCGVDPKKCKSIKEEINYIISNYESLSKQCLVASKQFDWKYICKKYIELYNMITCRRDDYE